MLKKQKQFTLCLGAGNGTATEGNGCVRFVEIATQTVNLTNILTNLNSSVINYNNTSDICIEQTAPPMQMTSNTLNDEQNEPDTIPNQLHNTKNNNGHCITDGASKNNYNNNSIADDNDDGSHDSQMCHATEIAEIDDNSGIDTHTLDSTNTDATVKFECNALATIDACDTTTIAKAHAENDTVIDDTEHGNRHPETENVNGPTNDFHV